MSRLSLPLLPDPRSSIDAVPDRLLQRLSRLPRRTQQVLLLSRLDGQGLEQIAERLDLPLGSVERLMTQALHSTLPSPDGSLMQASRWYVRLQSPAASTCERIDFRRWLDAQPSHLQAFHATELHWRALLGPARLLGESGSYRQGRAALSLGGCSLAAGLGLLALLALSWWV